MGFWGPVTVGTTREVMRGVCVLCAVPCELSQPAQSSRGVCPHCLRVQPYSCSSPVCDYVGVRRETQDSCGAVFCPVCPRCFTQQSLIVDSLALFESVPGFCEAADAALDSRGSTVYGNHCSGRGNHESTPLARDHVLQETCVWWIACLRM